MITSAQPSCHNQLKSLNSFSVSLLEREGLSWNDILRARRFDLDRPRRGWLLEGLGPCLAGNANDLKLLYIRVDDGWRKILDEFGQSLIACAQAVPPCPVPSRSSRRSSSTHGWPDLALWQHGSASEGDQRVYQFNGNVYEEIACNHVNYQSLGGSSYSNPRFTPCDIPSDFLAMLQNDLEQKTYLQHLKACLEEKGTPFEANVRIWWFDLNQYDLDRPHQGLVVQPLHPCPGGNDEEMFLYIRGDKSWRPILHTRSDSLIVDRPLDPWCPAASGSPRRSSSTHGWPDLIIGRNISATERQTVCLRFDGHVYKETQ
jgi:hypothetical protein